MMCSMFKKTAVGVGAGALALGLMFGTSAPSYVKAFVSHARKNVKSNVPIDIQIERARQEIANLEPAIHQGIEALAKAEVEVEDLTNQVAAHKQTLDNQQRKLVALRGQLDSGYRRTDGSNRGREIEAAAARVLDSFKHSKQLLVQKEETLALKRQQVDAARITLEKMMESKKLLSAKIEQIETQLQQIQATQASNEFTFDSTALSRAKQSIGDLEKRLAEMAKVAEYEGRMVDADLMIVEPTRDVAQEIDEELHAAPSAPGDKPL